MKNSWFDGTDVPPPPRTMWTVPWVVSTTSVRVVAGSGVRAWLFWCPRIGWERS